MAWLVRILADGLLLAILAGGSIAGLVAWRQNKRLSKSAPYAIMAALTSLLTAKLVSLMYQPSLMRPYLEKGVAAGAAYIDNPGFPSDHALLATVVVVMVYRLTPYRRFAVLLGVLAVVMSAARVAALVHTPFDVAAGVAFGLAGIFWYARMSLR